MSKKLCHYCMLNNRSCVIIILNTYFSCNLPLLHFIWNHLIFFPHFSSFKYFFIHFFGLSFINAILFVQKGRGKLINKCTLLCWSHCSYLLHFQLVVEAIIYKKILDYFTSYKYLHEHIKKNLCELQKGRPLDEE